MARDLFKRTEMGEFDSRIYLPSVPQLMQEYGISKSTASNAIALLSDIGFVRILDKKGIVPAFLLAAGLLGNPASCTAG